ncbi:3-oxoacyl-[acyl-carrier protein] reductase [freshwater sediment metagenome]|uniref:3-oxoacyl-[acyl-carrier protein] reductase n=1 Tax=freshwater sediment metagenome TaxID=556182 RepID=A0AA48LYX3_9ZZZZ
MTSPRVALVTGASRGIGRALALELARDGAHIVALARTQGALEELDDEIQALGSTATLVPCDITDFDALDRLGAAIFQRWGKLDVFVGNAGVLGPLSPLAHVDIKDWNRIIAVNVTANWRLIRSLDPLLRASGAGRVAFVTSSAAYKAQPFWGAYGASKAALETMARTYAAETKDTGVTVMIVNPGRMRTRMRAQAMPGEDATTLPAPEDFASKCLPLLKPEWAESGRLYDFPSDRLMDFHPPA